jgi:formylmethanofuran dehydrogenase subunit C
LTLRAQPAVPLEAPSIRPDAFASLDAAEIARLPAWHGKEPVRLGDFFAVEGGRSDHVVVRGDLARVAALGWGMAGGRLVVEGPVGRHAGANMRGGVLRVEGRAGDAAGAEMAGGRIEILGSAGDRVGAPLAARTKGMTGGVVLVHGSAGDAAGERLRRGLIAVAGSAGERAGAHMIAGTLLVCGELGRRAGVDLKRGTIVAGSGVALLPTFRYACTYRPGWLELLFRSLEAQGFPLAARLASGSFRRYGGDYAGLGRGEILEWTSASPTAR